VPGARAAAEHQRQLAVTHLGIQLRFAERRAVPLEQRPPGLQHRLAELGK